MFYVVSILKRQKLMIQIIVYKFTFIKKPDINLSYQHVRRVVVKL